MDDRINNRVCISKEMNGTRIEVWMSGEEDIRASVILLEKLSRRLPIEQTRILAEAFWETIGDGFRINEKVSDKGQRIALSLLHDYPDAKNNSDIMDECGLSKDDTYDYLSGRTGDMKDWFTSVKKGVWAVTKFGEKKLFELVELLLEKREDT
jgi:hypothetical protein